MNVIDSHTHFFSFHFFEALIELASSEGDQNVSLENLSQKTGIEIPHSDPTKHLNKWLDEMKKNQVDHMVTFASLPQEIDAVSQAIKQSQGKLTGYSLINPTQKNIANQISSLASKGFRGLLLFPVMHNYSVADSSIWPVFEIARQHQMIIVVHFGLLNIKLRDVLKLKRTYDLRYGNPVDLQITANQFKDLHFVIPHFGCGFFRETLMIGSQCGNVWVDTSSSNSWITSQVEKITLKDVFDKALNVFGAERILFGTDSSIFPRGWRQEIFNEQLSILNQLNISETKVNAIFSENARQLLNVTQTQYAT